MSLHERESQSGGPPPPSNYTVLMFIKSLAAPVVLYSDNPVSLYEELKRTIQAADAANPKMVEKPGVGPLKKVAILDTQIAGVALQSSDG